MARRNSVSPSRGKAFDMPDTHPTAPMAMLSTMTSSRPANSTKRSPTMFLVSMKRLVSPEESLKQTTVSTSASVARIRG